MRWRNSSTPRLALAVVFCGACGASGQSDVETFQQLVETAASRLAVAERVALAKWDSHLPVEDAAREAQVIDRAVRTGRSSGLEEPYVSSFFKAQIDASKLVQSSLLDEWRRGGRAPDHSPIDLTKSIRPELDRLDTALIARLKETSAFRARASCRTDVAKAVSNYVSARKDRVSPLLATALDRAMTATCQ